MRHPTNVRRFRALALVTALMLAPVLLRGAAADVPATQPGDRRIRVACVGDSITFGSGIKDRDRNSYPAQLQGLLGGGYEVRNFGVSGATLLRAGDRPYWKEPALEEAKQFAPDIVVIKLGTNDSKPQNWKHCDDFARDLAAMIAEFRSLERRPPVWVCRPVPAYAERWGIRDRVIRGEMIPVIDRVAQEHGVPVIDLYDALGGKPDLFPDTIHPDAGGAALIARAVHKAVTAHPVPATAPSP